MYCIVKGESAQDKFKRMREKQKFEVYGNALAHQDIVIEEAMAKGLRKIGFFFNYPEQKEHYRVRYNAEEWFDEFRENAIRQYEANGYTINGSMISW